MSLAAWTVVSASLLIGLLAGFFMHRSDYCLAGTFRDFFLFRATDRLVSLLMLIVLSAFLFELLRLANLLPSYPFPWFDPPSLSNILGGIVFGVGMVMAGGCVVGVLYKFGSGSAISGVAVLGLVAGSALYAELHPTWKIISQPLVLGTEAVTIPQMTGCEPAYFIFPIVLVSWILLWKFRPGKRLSAGNRAEGYIPLWVTAVALALLGALSVVSTSIPMGVSTSYAKAAAIIESIFAPEHVANTEFFISQKAHLLLPGGTETILGGGGPKWDAVAIVQYPLILGIVFGSAISAKLLGEFRFYWKVPMRQVLMVFTGGVVMALGARMAPGCNVWHLLGGMPILAIQSVFFISGMVPGTWLGSLIMKRILIA